MVKIISDPPELGYVTSMSITQKTGEFTEITLTIMAPVVGIGNVSSLLQAGGKVNLGQIFNSEPVKAAVQKAINDEVRKITLTDE